MMMVQLPPTQLLLLVITAQQKKDAWCTTVDKFGSTLASTTVRTTTPTALNKVSVGKLQTAQITTMLRWKMLNSGKVDFNHKETFSKHFKSSLKYRKLKLQRS
jgi:hypothetical protein